VTCGRSGFSPGTPVSSTNKTDHNDITEILLKHHNPPAHPYVKVDMTDLSNFLVDKIILNRLNQNYSVSTSAYVLQYNLVIVSRPHVFVNACK